MLLPCSLLLSTALGQTPVSELPGQSDTGGGDYVLQGHGEVDDPGISEIVGGRQVREGDWREVVLVASNGGLCTGTVIGPRVVLTADHCVTRPPSFIMFDSTDYQRDPGPFVEADGIEDTFRFISQGYDLAIVTLRERAPVDPVPIALDCVLRDHLQDGERAWMVGFGATSSTGGGFNSQLNEAGTTIVDRNCDQARIDGVSTGCLPQINPGGEVAGMTDDAHVCYGDSGGPLYLRTPSGPYVAGVASRLFLGSPGNAPCSSGSIWVRPDALIDEIERVVGNKRILYPTCNEAPAISAPSLVETREAEAVDVPLTATDPDGEGDVTWAIAQAPQHGSATIDASGTVTYTPREGFVGRDAFTVSATDAGIARWPRTGQPQTGELDVVVTVLEQPLLACSSVPMSASWLLLMPGLLLLRRRR